MNADVLLLRALRRGGWVPAGDLGPELAGRVPELNAAGYEIEHHPHLGFRLRLTPDRLIADDILARLPDCQWLRDIRVFEKTGSTNDLVAGLGRDGAAAGIAIFAEQQTAGRGRLGRVWQSEERKGLWFSLLLRPALPLGEWPRLTLWLAWAVARGIEGACGVRPALKWPNDLLLGGRKACGILVETALGERPFAVAGMGLNVNQTGFPAPLDATATSLRLHAGAELDRNGLAASILGVMDETSGQMEPGADFGEVLAWADGADFLRGRWITAETGGEKIEGQAAGIDAEGALVVRRASGGEPVRLRSGEVVNFSFSASD